MGIETALFAVAVAAEVGKMGAEMSAADSEESALDLQAKETQVNYQQKTLSSLDSVQKVLDAQKAQMTISGTAFSSPSFNAIQRNTLNIGGKQLQNLDTEEDIAQSNIRIEKANVKSKLYASLFGDITQSALAGYNIYGKMPTKAK